MPNIKSTPNSNYLQRNGFIMVSNLLIDYQEELGITDDELVFITKVMKNTSSWRLHDSDISKSVSSKTLQRRRKSLKEKGLLEYKTVTITNSLGQKFNDGIMYDLSKLEQKLQEISNKIEEKKVETIKKEIKENNIDLTDEDFSTITESSLLKYQKDWYNYYRTKYELSKQERDEYNKLSPFDKRYFKYVFEYCSENNLLSKITPRLSLFLKTKFRMNDLKNWCNENKAEFKINQEKEETPLSDKELLDKWAEQSKDLMPKEEIEKELTDDNGLTEDEMKQLFEDLTGNKYLPAAKKVYEMEIGKELILGEPYYVEKFNKIFAVLMENGIYDPDKINVGYVLSMCNLKGSSDVQDVWTNEVLADKEIETKSGLSMMEDDKQKEEDPVFGNLFDSSLTAKIKEQENYHQTVQKEAANKINGMSSEDVLKMWEDDPQKLDDFVAKMEI